MQSIKGLKRIQFDNCDCLWNVLPVIENQNLQPMVAQSWMMLLAWVCAEPQIFVVLAPLQFEPSNHPYFLPRNCVHHVPIRWQSDGMPTRIPFRLQVSVSHLTLFALLHTVELVLAAKSILIVHMDTNASISIRTGPLTRIEMDHTSGVRVRACMCLHLLAPQ
jgi:hypothetical protein